MHVIRLFISILSDFVTSHKITFYSKLYDIDLLEMCTHDRTYITLYVHEFLLSLHQHCFLDKKAPRTTLTAQILRKRIDSNRTSLVLMEGGVSLILLLKQTNIEVNSNDNFVLIISEPYIILIYRAILI